MVNDIYTRLKASLGFEAVFCFRGDWVYFEELALGMAVEIAPTKIQKENMIAFAKEYDNIPLHTHEEYAKTTPFGGLIAPGMFSYLSVWQTYLTVDFFGNELLAGKSTQIEWEKPVYANDVLTGKATITHLEKRNPKNGLVEISMEVTNQKGELVLTALCKAVVKCKSVTN